MKKIFFLLLAFSISAVSVAQDLRKIESLDIFFGGVPLQMSYEKWVLHVAAQFGIDSTGKRGIYSSFKPDTKSHFPFPDSVQVKILLYTALNIRAPGKKGVDTIRSVLIEGIFGNGSKGIKAANSYFDTLKSMLKVYYEKSTAYPDHTANFLNGINKNFPDVYLESGYYTEQDFFYVILMCLYDQRIKH